MNRMILIFGVCMMGLALAAAVDGAAQTTGKQPSKNPPKKKAPSKKAPHHKDHQGVGVGHPLNNLMMTQFGHHGHMSGSAFKKLPGKKKTTIKMYYLKNQGNLNAPQKTAVNKILSGQQLSTQDRNSLTGLLSEGKDITPEVREAITEALTVDGQAQRIAKSTRYLRLYNATNESLRVWVQYHTYTDKDTWAWFPAAPENRENKAVVYELKAGQTAALTHDKWSVHANLVRLWGRTAGGKMLDQYQNQDLILVPEMNDAGQPCYYASELETYTYTFPAAGSSVSELSK